MGSVISSSSISFGLLLCYLTTVTSMQNQVKHCYGKSAPLYGAKKCCHSAREWYIPSQSLCCGGKIERLDDVTKHECCGDRIINTTEKICCDNIAHPIIDPDSGKRRNTCCPGTGNVYKYRTDVCCMDSNMKYTLRIAKPKEDLQCCLGNPFDKNNSSATCDFSTGLVSICGEIPFDARDDSCCAGTLIKGYPSGVANRACCGKKNYNTDDEKCCIEPNVEPFDIHKSRECCGNTSYDPTSQICCRSQVFEREKYKNCATAVKLEFGCGGKVLGPNEECCKKSGATLHSKTEVSYNKATEQCCGGTVVPKSAECCGGEPIKTEQRDEYICCRKSHKTRRDGPDHDACCKAYHTDKYDNAPKYTSYNSKTMICTEGQPMPKNSKYQQYCGGTPLKPNKLCCNGQQHNKRSSTKTKCCGVKSFNYDFEMCCKGRVGTQKEHVCCYEGLKNRNKLDKQCQKVEETQKYCQGRPYDDSTYTCGTQGELYMIKKIEGMIMAHNAVIKPKRKSPRLPQCKWCKEIAVNGTKWQRAWTEGICLKKYVVSVQITSQISGTNVAAMANIKDNDIRKSRRKNTYRPDFFQTANRGTISVKASSCQCSDILEQNRELIIMTDNLIDQNGSLNLSDNDIVIENKRIIRKKIKRKMRRRGKERCERVTRRRG
ncbi:unnamed protein product [Owenia fusiformis]|uniref:Galaxin-like repeats domain-containing protein n=1 Tax=Owenia fusiformis TaxID=6347 RepID=A0A8J1XXU0_OWEFU|nr:unnamed protein product [Owenia fusiformis]